MRQEGDYRALAARLPDGCGRVKISVFVTSPTDDDEEFAAVQAEREEESTIHGTNPPIAARMHQEKRCSPRVMRIVSVAASLSGLAIGHWCESARDNDLYDCMHAVDYGKLSA